MIQMMHDARPIKKRSNRKKSKPSLPTHRTRSNPLRRSSHKSFPNLILDPSHIPNQSYLARGVKWHETHMTKSTIKKKTIEEYKRYKALYRDKLNHDKQQITEVVNCTVEMPSVPFPKTTTKDIVHLVNKCKLGEAQVISEELLFEIGFYGTARTHSDKSAKIIRGIQSLFQ